MLERRQAVSIFGRLARTVERTVRDRAHDCEWGSEFVRGISGEVQ